MQGAAGVGTAPARPPRVDGNRGAASAEIREPFPTRRSWCDRHTAGVMRLRKEERQPVAAAAPRLDEGGFAVDGDAEPAVSAGTLDGHGPQAAVDFDFEGHSETGL